MEQTKWIERKFSFDFPVSHLPNVLERLRGTTLRLEAVIRMISEKKAGIRHNHKWSIKEHIGHLGDLENLHEGRIDDFLIRKEVLRAADMSNKATNSANHNQSKMATLVEEFAKKRSVFIFRLEHLAPEIHDVSSLHPRLKIKMRPVDMAYFTAEHDDHHMSSIRTILQQYG